jgi:hypothetical protein
MNLDLTLAARRDRRIAGFQPKAAQAATFVASLAGRRRLAPIAKEISQ